MSGDDMRLLCSAPRCSRFAAPGHRYCSDHLVPHLTASPPTDDDALIAEIDREVAANEGRLSNAFFGISADLLRRIRARLSAIPPKQEPVAWMYTWPDRWIPELRVMRLPEIRHSQRTETPLYAIPPKQSEQDAAQPKVQRWTTDTAIPSDLGGFVAYGDYLAAIDRARDTQRKEG